jgi:hypothetical protein
MPEALLLGTSIFTLVSPAKHIPNVQFREDEEGMGI